MTTLPGQVQCGQNEHECEQDVRPGVQRPLTAPGQIPGAREGKKIGNGPLITVRSTGARQIAQEVEMKGGQNERAGPQAAPGEKQRRDPQKEPEREVVAKRVVEL